MRRRCIEQLKKGITETALLLVISEVQTYGYNIIKELEKRTLGYLKLKGGTIYPALRRLELRGLVKSWQQQDNGSQRVRKYYQITDKGRQLLFLRLREWRNFSGAVSTLMGIGDAHQVASSKTA
jgi:PadR family transcriptional regulator PadR